MATGIISEDTKKCIIFVCCTLFYVKIMVKNMDIKFNLNEELVQFSHSHVQLFATLWTIARQAFLFITNSPNLFKLMSIDMVGDAIQPSHPLLSPSLPAFNISQHQGLFK